MARSSCDKGVFDIRSKDFVVLSSQNDTTCSFYTVPGSLNQYGISSTISQAVGSYFVEQGSGVDRQDIVLTIDEEIFLGLAIMLYCIRSEENTLDGLDGVVEIRLYSDGAVCKSQS